MKELNNNNVSLSASASNQNQQVLGASQQGAARTRSAGYLKFTNFAARHRKDGDVLVKFIDPKNTASGLRAANIKDDGFFGCDMIGPLFRRQATKDVNNNVRTLFAEALRDRFGGEFDLFQALGEDGIADMKLEDFIGSKAAKAARRGGHFTLNELVAQTRAGKTGCPLSARRITAISTVLEKYQDGQNQIYRRSEQPKSVSTGELSKDNGSQDNIQDEKPNKSQNNNVEVRLRGTLDNPIFTFGNANKIDEQSNEQQNEQLNIVNIENKNIIEVPQNKTDEQSNEQLNEQQEVKVEQKENNDDKPEYVAENDYYKDDETNPTPPLKSDDAKKDRGKIITNLFNKWGWPGDKNDGAEACKKRLGDGRFTIDVESTVTITDGDTGKKTTTTNKAMSVASGTTLRDELEKAFSNDQYKKEKEFAVGRMLLMLSRVSRFGVDAFLHLSIKNCYDGYRLSQNPLPKKPKIELKITEKTKNNKTFNEIKLTVIEKTVTNKERKVTATFPFGAEVSNDGATLIFTGV